MIGSNTGSPVGGTKAKRSIGPVLLYTLVLSATATGSAVIIASLGSMAHFQPAVRGGLWLAWAALSGVYALRELSFVRLPVVSRRWVVPATWVSGPGWRNACIWGACLGSGAVTRIVYPAFHASLAWLFLTGAILPALLFGSAYGSARGLPLLARALRLPQNRLEAPQQLVFSMQGVWHYVLGAALAYAGALVSANRLA